MGSATIYDVAEHAGVSIATVSRMLNSPHKVNKATRSRVLAAIDALGFVPKAEATARARKSAGRIGVLAPFFTYPSFVQRLRGVSEIVAGSSYELVIYNVDTVARREAYLASLPIARRLDGLIIMALPFGAEAASRLVSHGLQVVLIECANPLFSSVEIDDREGGRIAGEYLVDRGYRRIGFVGDSQVPEYAIPTSERRLEGLRDALRVRSIDIPERYVTRAPHGMEPARLQTLQLLNLPDPPEAIFAPSDTQAMGVLKAARQRQLRVPEDLAVIGFDDIDAADYIGLTTVHQSLDESGRVAVELLMTCLTDRTRGMRRIQLPLTLVRRETA
ncbi:MAG: LacI family DNA-binding transcriptional regulator [Roseiflexaceae bacterium]|nr:LacI family DNA-binding transcriptional regulator [Roseiflexaceae bacterium]